MERFLQDLRFACRTLRKRPGFTIAAVFTLGLGIGANVAIFSLVNGLLFKQVPGLEDTRGLVEISRNLDGDFFDISYPALTRLRERSDALMDMAGFKTLPLALGDEHEPSVHMGLAVTGNYFAMLGLQPAAGRFFSPQRSFFPQIESSAVISHHLWEQGFQSRADVIGRTIRLNGHPMVVIGVAPKGFRGHAAALRMDIFALIGAPLPGFPLQDTLRQPDSGILEVLGRLKPGGAEVLAGFCACWKAFLPRPGRQRNSDRGGGRGREYEISGGINTQLLLSALSAALQRTDDPSLSNRP
ncbi:MAG: ABC transporter permease [Acidobacteriota bacterium]